MYEASGTVVKNAPVADPPAPRRARRSCRQCGHDFRDHISGARCRVPNCDCSLFLSMMGSDEHLAVERVMAVARMKDQFIHDLPDGHGQMRIPPPGLPAPIGMDCPDHPSFALLIKGGLAWCRRGMHFWEPPG
jgi:hypothetical protein